MIKDRKKKVSSVSWPDWSLRDKAKERAASLGLSLSAYVNQLVVRDLHDGGDFVIMANGRKRRGS